MGEIKMTRCLEGCGRKWRQKQGKSEWQKQKKKEVKEKTEKKREEKTGKKQKKQKMIKVKRIAEEWEIWNEEEEVAKSEVEVKKLVLEKFHKWIKGFSKK